MNIKKLLNLLQKVKKASMKAEGVKELTLPRPPMFYVQAFIKSIIFAAIALGLIRYGAQADVEPLNLTIGLVLFSIVYVAVYLIANGLLMQILAMAFAAAIITALSAAFPPFVILAVLFAIGVFLKQLKAILYILPWVILGLPYYYGVFYASQHGLNAIQTPPVALFYAIPILTASLFLGYRYPFKKGLFNMAIMFATVPIIALYIYADDVDEMDGADISGADGDVYVRQYLRADGTIVEAHYRAMPNV